MIKLGYDAGHGLNTAGKRTPDGEREWSFNDKVARAFANELALYEGITSKRFDDPTGKSDVPLKTRTDGANSWGATYYISFHKNALAGKWGTHTGVETWIYENTKRAETMQLANAIHPAVVKAFGLRDRGIKKGNLHIVRETDCPAILIEGPFMDSTIDIKNLRDNKILENAGKEIARAFVAFAGLKKACEVKGTPIIKEELTVGQYEELKGIIQAQAKRIEVLEASAGVKERAVAPDHRVAWEWAQSQGLVNGKNPNRPLTREQFATIEYRKSTKN